MNTPKFNFRRTRFFLFTLFFSGLLVSGFTQNLDYNAKVSIVLSDGTPVTLYAQLIGTGMSAKTGNNYYYLPTQIVLAKDPQTQEIGRAHV